jgi:hypothetical protein
MQYDAADNGQQDNVTRLSQMLLLYQAARDEVEKAEAALQLAKQRFNSIEQIDFPELMKEIGLSEMKMSDGTKLTLDSQIQCSITDEKRDAALAWLEANGLGGIIKNKLAAEFGRDQIDEAREAATRIAEDFEVVCEVVGTVHVATLKATLGEELKQGKAVPEDLFGLRIFDRVKVKEAKKV